jgi:Lycopene cyclase
MVPDNYIYLIALTPFVIVWLLFWFLRKDVRKEMLIMGVLWSFLSIGTEYIWFTRDWWRPLTIMGTRVSVEDLLLGFFVGGISAVLYEVLFHERHLSLRIQHVHRSLLHKLLTILFILLSITSLLFWGFGLTSFCASSIAFIVAALVMFVLRKDLFIDGLLSAVLLVTVSTLFYSVIEFLSPHWISRTYLWGTLSGILIVGVPVEEFIFWFLVGFVFGPLYEFWQGERLVKIHR